MIAFAVGLASATLATGILAAVAIRRLPTLAMQMVAFALVAVTLPVVAVLATGFVMFSGHDLSVVIVACGAALAALGGALVLARSLTRQIARLRVAPAAMAAGELSARAPRGGPAEIDGLAASFNTMAEHVEDLFDSRRQLVAWAGHDLRTPLASLQAMIEAVEDGIVEADHYLPAMHAQVDALGGLIEDLFELARLDAGAINLEMRPAPVQSLVEACLRGAEAEADARRVHLDSQIADDIPAVRCAPDKVGRVLDNLVRNALRHTPRDGHVSLVVLRDENLVRLSVEDTGEGLAPEAIRQMFDHFWRGDRARVRDGAGAGLGLAIARGLVEAHGGRIWAENRDGGGARVCFTLPTAEATAA